MALVLLQLLLNGREHLGLHERGDRDRDPVLRWDITDGDGPARLHGTVALGAQPGAQGLLARLAKRRGALIGRILQDAPHDTPIPHGLARAGHLARLGQPPTDLPNRQAVVADPGKDLADHAGFVRDDLIAGLPTALVLGHIAVPIGGAAEHIDRPDLGRMALATPMPLDDLGPLILGNHPLHLQQQVVFGALPQGPVEEHRPRHPRGGTHRPAGLDTHICGPSDPASAHRAGPHSPPRSHRAGAPAPGAPGWPHYTLRQEIAWPRTRLSPSAATRSRKAAT